MNRQKAQIVVKGAERQWGVDWWATTEQIEAMRGDGLEVNIVLNTIPLFIVNAGLTRLWCFWQDVFNFRNPFNK